MSTRELPPGRPRYSGGQIAMTLFGVVLLLPGLCSVSVMLSMTNEIRRGDPYLGLFVVIWVVCFVVSAGGAALIYLARKRARAGAEPRDAGRGR